MNRVNGCFSVTEDQYNNRDLFKLTNDKLNVLINADFVVVEVSFLCDQTVMSTMTSNDTHGVRSDFRVEWSIEIKGAK